MPLSDAALTKGVTGERQIEVARPWLCVTTYGRTKGNNAGRWTNKDSHKMATAKAATFAINDMRRVKRTPTQQHQQQQQLPGHKDDGENLTHRQQQAARQAGSQAGCAMQRLWFVVA